MPADQSARLGLPLLQPSQAAKHVTCNTAFLALDALVQASVVSASQTAQPTTPADGTQYILPLGATGEAWSQFSAHSLVRFDAGAWHRIEVPTGALVHAFTEGRYLSRTATGWASLSEHLGPMDNLSGLGIATQATATNRLAVVANGVSFSGSASGAGATGDMRVTVNRAAPSATASIVFQTGWSGRAELGIAGNDNLSVRQSPDGQAWATTLTMDTGGRVGLGIDVPTAALHVCGLDPNQPVAILTRFASNSTPSSLTFQRARGTVTAPSPVLEGDRIMSLLSRGWLASGSWGGNSAAIACTAAGDFLASSQPTRITFEVTGSGATSRQTVLSVEPNGTIRLTPLAMAPDSPQAGQLYFDSTLGQFRGYTGAQWVGLS